MTSALGRGGRDTRSAVRADIADLIVACAVVVLYTILTVALLPVAEYPRALGAGALVLAGTAAVARMLGRGPIGWLGVYAVMAVAAVVLVFPTFPAMGGTQPVATPLGFLGTQAAVLLYGALRWQPRPAVATHVPLRRAWQFALMAALALSAIAAIPVLVVLVTEGARGILVLLVFPGYVIGMLGAATAVWLLQRIAHLATGCYLIGVLGGFCLYGAIGPAVDLFDRKPIDPHEIVVIASILGAMVGPAVALALGSTSERRSRHATTASD